MIFASPWVLLALAALLGQQQSVTRNVFDTQLSGPNERMTGAGDQHQLVLVKPLGG